MANFKRRKHPPEPGWNRTPASKSVPRYSTSFAVGVSAVDVFDVSRCLWDADGQAAMADVDRWQVDPDRWLVDVDMSEIDVGRIQVDAERLQADFDRWQIDGEIR